MADFPLKQDVDIQVGSIQYPWLPTHKGMARVNFHTGFVDSTQNDVEITVEVKLSNQPPTELLVIACKSLAEDLRSVANKLDAIADST